MFIECIECLSNNFNLFVTQINVYKQNKHLQKYETF